MKTTSRNMKNRVWKVDQHLLLKIGLLLSTTAAIAHGMPTTMMSTQDGLQCENICKLKRIEREQERKSSANCSGRQREKAPESCHFVEELIMDDNHVPVIDKTMFETFHHLAYLRMRNNGITTIHGGSFANTALKDIDLSENYLVELNNDVFHNLINLTQLNLKHNRLEQIRNHSLPKLTSLIVSENRIQQLSHVMFDGMPNLKNLDLSHNFITELEINFLGKLRNLLILRLSNNKIANINRNAFEFLQNLQELHLDNNSISMNSFQYAKIFSRQQQLKVLNISYNNLDGLQSHMLFHLRDSLEEFSVSNNKISSIDGKTFIGFRRLQHIDLTNNKLTANSTVAFQTLVGKSATHKVKILLAGNPICDEYLEEFKDCYNVTVFCNETQTKAYAAKDVPNTSAPVINRMDPATQDPQQMLTTICFVVAAVLLLVVVVLPVFIWKRYKGNNDAYSMRHTFSNRGYYPRDTETIDQAPEQDPPPPPVPERGPNIPLPAEDHEGPYLNGNIGTGTTASYIQPTSTCDSRGRSSCPHHHRSPRRSRSSNRLRPPVYAKSSPDLHKSTGGSPDSIMIVGTNFGGSCRSVHVTGLPKIKKQWRQSMSRHLPGWYTHRFETRGEKPVERGAEANESTYMMRQETEDGRPVNSTLETKNTTADQT